MSLAYRPEIDGLRAIAVSSVVVYHLKIAVGETHLIAGGYLGVDVFFVLSGYLITLILLKEVAQDGRISYRGFYARRARRILPALLFVMLASFPAAWAILLPQDMITFVKSQIATLFFVANGFWFVEQGVYGAASGLLQPFLNTWSLAVEEQFYILFPLVLTLLFRRGWVGNGLAVLVALTFVLSIASTAFKPQYSFYSSISRSWELGVGALLAWVTFKQRLPRGSWTRAAPSVALVVLGLCLVGLPLSEISHPGVITLVPVLATAVLVAFTGQDEPVTRLLSRAPLVWVGLVSYSLYLWHFPVFAFGRLVRLDPGPVDWIVWILLSVAGAWISYRLVERPMRFHVSTARFAMLTASGAVLIGAFAVTMMVTQGYRERLGGLIALYDGREFDNLALRDASWAVLETAGPPRPFLESNPHDFPSAAERNASWFSDDDSTKVLVVGNSHSKDLFNALHLNRDKLPSFEFARFGLAAVPAQAQIEQLLASPNFREADVVVYAPRYGPRMLAGLPDLLARMQAQGKQVVVALNTAEFDSPSRFPLFDHVLRTEGPEAVADDLPAIARAQLSPRVGEINAEVRRIAEDMGLPVLDRAALICGAETCRLTTPDGRKLLYDYGHWTPAGAEYLGSLLIDGFRDGSYVDMPPGSAGSVGASGSP